MAVPLQAGLVEHMGIKRSTDKVHAVVADVHTMHYRLQLHHTHTLTARLTPAQAHSAPAITVLPLLPCLIHAHVVRKNCAPLSMHCMQIRLPKSAGDALMSQDAPKNGAMLFELSTSAGRSLHAGVLDFSAAQGTVGVPEHLIRNLWGLTTGDGQCHGHVIVTYKKLPQGIATAAMHPSIALQYCSQALQCTIAAKLCIVVLKPSIALQSCSRALHCSIAAKHCSTLLQPGIELQYCSQALHRSTATQ